MLAISHRQFKSAFLLATLCALGACGGGSNHSQEETNNQSQNESNNDTSSPSEDNDSTQQGAIAQFQTASLGSDLNSPYPIAIYLKLKANALSNYELFDNQNLHLQSPFLVSYRNF